MIEALEFRVEEWSADGQHVVELVAAASNALVARAAFREAVELRPAAWITLRHRARVICERTVHSAGNT